MNSQSNQTQIYLMPITSTQLLHYREIIKALGFDIKPTINVGFFELGNIACKIKPGIRPLFSYLSIFQIEVWFSILVSLIFISIIISVFKNSWISFFKILWRNSIIMVSESSPQFFKIKSSWEKIIIGVWLFSAMGLSIGFCTYLLDYMIEAIPEVIIDSWNDLYHRKDIKIIVFDDSSMAKFAMDDISDMARSFKSRLETAEIGDWKTNQFKYDLIEKLQTGEYAFVVNKLVLLFALETLAKMIKNKDKSFRDSLHVSKDGGGYLSYFIPVNSDINENILESLNEM